ncbi:MAG TPA: type VI secretion system tube protein Hcp [Pyrinomonadaceae bacterium]|nr:type VI secretion system tube protein Hcp [Pyrinomonadaceae bacterium]
MASVDYYLEIDGIKGESEDHEHKDKLEIQSWSWGESNAGSMASGGGGGTGKVSMQDFHFTVNFGMASPKLAQACAGGDHIKKAVLYCRKAGTKAQKYLNITFSDILISSYQVGGSAGSSVAPSDQISFNFAKIEMGYFKQDAKGITTPAGEFKYDQKKNTAA